MRIGPSCLVDMREEEQAAHKEMLELQEIVFNLTCILHLRPQLAFQAVEFYLK
jgi:hypothetical protein